MRETRNSIADIWGERTPYVDNWPTRVDERILEEPERWVQSACLLCSNERSPDITATNQISVKLVCYCHLGRSNTFRHSNPLSSVIRKKKAKNQNDSLKRYLKNRAVVV